MPLEKLEYEGHQLLKWTMGPSAFFALPQAGARLMNWSLNFADGSVRDVIYWPADADYSNIAKVRGGNPILFPFAGRTWHKGEPNQWHPPHREPAPMPQNGIARQGTFRLESASEVGFLAIFEPDADAKKAYPYEYEFSVNYRFKELSMTVEMQLMNYDKVAIPWSAGHHFYFNLPWHSGSERKDYGLNIPAKKAWCPDMSNGKLEPIKNFASETDFADPELSDRVHTHLKKSEIRFGPKSGEEDIVIRHGLEKKPNAAATVVTWSAGEDSPYYCVEPWMGPPNAPEHETGLHFVNPGQKQHFCVEVSLNS